MKSIHKSSRSAKIRHGDNHRFEHWYVDNQIYFITARCRDQFPAFAAESAKRVFWDRFEHYTREAAFTPIVTSLLDNHYHVLGYNRHAHALKTMMQRLHGSIAKCVNDLLAAASFRLLPFWRDTKGREYFDGCIRNEKQFRLAYRYTLTQSRRHRICADWRQYAHTRVNVPLDAALKRALELRAFMPEIAYPRYQRGPGARPA